MPLAPARGDRSTCIQPSVVAVTKQDRLRAMKAFKELRTERRAITDCLKYCRWLINESYPLGYSPRRLVMEVEKVGGAQVDHRDGSDGAPGATTRSVSTDVLVGGTALEVTEGIKSATARRSKEQGRGGDDEAARTLIESPNSRLIALMNIHEKEMTKMILRHRSEFFGLVSKVEAEHNIAMNNGPPIPVSDAPTEEMLEKEAELSCREREVEEDVIQRVLSSVEREMSAETKWREYKIKTFQDGIAF